MTPVILTNIGIFTGGLSMLGGAVLCADFAEAVVFWCFMAEVICGALSIAFAYLQLWPVAAYLIVWAILADAVRRRSRQFWETKK